jgi:His-Xaa-Ser system protein HxsD
MNIEAAREEHRTSESLTLLRISPAIAGAESILKACYWFSRDFMCEVKEEDPGNFLVSLRPKTTSLMSCEEVRESFMGHVLDFELRERITVKTKDVRDLLLAKAFAESGVLEDAPQGVFGDELEESKPDGIFKILSNG